MRQPNSAVPYSQLKVPGLQPDKVACVHADLYRTQIIQGTQLEEGARLNFCLILTMLGLCLTAAILALNLSAASNGETIFDIVGSEVYESLEPIEFYDAKNIKLENSQMIENLETLENLENLDGSNEEKIYHSGKVYPEKQTEDFEIEDEINVKDEDGIMTNQPLDSFLNNRPIIGVLSQELDNDLRDKLPAGLNMTAYIAASYVKWIESGGARVVPVIIGKSKSYYKKLFNSLNGLLLPGGSAALTGSEGYAYVGQLFFNWAKEANDNGDYFPIWGTCNGFELLTVMSMSDDQSRLTDCDSEDQALPLKLRGEWRQSRIYGRIPKHILQDLVKKPVTINFHHFCLTPTNFTKFGMQRFWNALSVNRDIYDLEYISTIEARNYPFVGVQFHPEKNIFEWSEKERNIPHNEAAVNVGSYFARYLVNMARRSFHSFETSVDEEYALIYNYQPLYSENQQVHMSFEQIYLF